MIKLTRRAVVAGLGAFAAVPARAEGTWPNRPVTLMHGFPPGGPVDTLSRILSEGLSRQVGQPVIVDSKPGATGTTAGGLVARATPDGYTLMALPATYPATAAMFNALPYNPTEDFTFISTTAEYPLVLVTYPDSEIRTVADIVSAARFAQCTPALRYCRERLADAPGDGAFCQKGKYPTSTRALQRRHARRHRSPRQAAGSRPRSADRTRAIHKK